MKNNNKIKLSFWGVRGSIPAPGLDTVYYGGNTSCISIEWNKQLIILDAGSGIRILGNHLIKQGKITGNKIFLFISHTHWDHIQGLPFFASAFIEGNQIQILGPKLYNQSFRKVIANQMEHSYFPIRLKNLGAAINFKELRIGSYDNIIDNAKVETTIGNHPVIDMCYRFTLDNKTICYVTDFELYNQEYINFNKKSLIKKINVIGKDIFNDLYNEIKNFVKDADYLIMDSVYTKEEYPNKLNWGHSTFEDVYNLAIKAKVKNLCFFHHEPNRTDKELKTIENKYKKLNKKDKKLKSVFAAREHHTITI